MINKDQLVDGPFGSNACYEQNFEQDGKQITTWLCFGSGFTTSTLMTEGSKPVADLMETSPELYKDLMHIDKDGKVWFPATITLPAKGMVFVDGTNKKDWKWAAVKAIPLTEEEKKSGRFPKDQEFRMDMLNSKKYEQKDFMDACEEIGFFQLT
jgi:hypothetical protein